MVVAFALWCLCGGCINLKLFVQNDFPIAAKQCQGEARRVEGLRFRVSYFSLFSRTINGNKVQQVAARRNKSQLLLAS